ncbi:hypothetical protein [Actinomyces howellii]|uniref:hypothetical protein n=1 Tax=Actinomyces howellii TaxID=52771 RepID=UPI000F819959|nr:hypothetical protein [Actinomyces howellii]
MADVDNPRRVALVKLRECVAQELQGLGMQGDESGIPESGVAKDASASGGYINAKDTWRSTLADSMNDEVRSRVAAATSVFVDLTESIETQIAALPEKVDSESDEAKWPNR